MKYRINKERIICLSIIVGVLVIVVMFSFLNEENPEDLDYLINEQNYIVYMKLTGDLRSLVMDLNYAQSLLRNSSVDDVYLLCYGSKLRATLDHVVMESRLLYIYFNSMYYKSGREKHRVLFESFDTLRRWAMSEISNFDEIIRSHNLSEIREWLNSMINYSDSLSVLSDTLDNARMNVIYSKKCRCLSELSEEYATVIFSTIQKLLRT